jgi:hypothetical protein
MSIRVDTASLIPGALVVGNRGLGVIGSSIPSTGDNGASFLYNDLTLPADANKEIRGLIISQPSAGQFYVYEDGSFEFSGAADGIYPFTYRLFEDGVDKGTTTGSINVGNVVPDSSPSTSLSLSFTNVGGVPRADLTGLNWAFFDQKTPDLLVAPVAKGANGTTDANGILVLGISGTTLLPGSIGWLIVSNSDGTINTNYIAFSGPVMVS